MATATKPTSRRKRPKTRRVHAVQATRSNVRTIKDNSDATPITAVGKLRARFGLPQATFARLLAVSIRTLATLESGATPTEPVARRLTELERLTDGLAEVIQKESLGQWILTPNQAFDGLRPLEVIERGQIDRLWEMLYFLRSGTPS